MQEAMLPAYTVTIPDGYTVKARSITGECDDVWEVFNGERKLCRIARWDSDSVGGRPEFTNHVRGQWHSTEYTLDETLRYFFKDYCDIEL
jgi:hypothetical protein